jgi:hypothetical protein
MAFFPRLADLDRRRLGRILHDRATLAGVQSPCAELLKHFGGWHHFPPLGRNLNFFCAARALAWIESRVAADMFPALNDFDAIGPASFACVGSLTGNVRFGPANAEPGKALRVFADRVAIQVPNW